VWLDDFLRLNASMAAMRHNALCDDHADANFGADFESNVINVKFNKCLRNKMHVVNWAAWHGHVTVLHFLTALGLTAQDVRDDLEALRCAAKNGHVAVLQCLLNLGMTHKDVDQSYAMWNAAFYGQVHVLQFFKEWYDSNVSGGLTMDDISKKRNINENVNNLILWCASRGHAGVLQWMLDAKLVMPEEICHPDVCKWAAEGQRMQVLRLLKTLGLTADMLRADNCVLLQAAYNGHVDVLLFLKELGFTSQDMRIRDGDVFCWAARYGHVAVLQFLKDVMGFIAQDARARNNWALRYAAHNGYMHVLQFLKDGMGLTVQDARAQTNFDEDHGLVLTNHRSQDNWALCWAAENGHIKVLQFFQDWRNPPGSATSEARVTAADARAVLHYIQSRMQRNLVVHNQDAVVQFLERWAQ